IVPLVESRSGVIELPVAVQAPRDICKGKLLVVIDDDPLVLNGTGGLLRSWGCQVVTGETDHAALTGLATHNCAPDLIISDFRLPGGKSGMDAIRRIGNALGTPIPAFLISGDTKPEVLGEARGAGYHLRHKPVEPMAIRAMLSQALREGCRSA